MTAATFHDSVLHQLERAALEHPSHGALVMADEEHTYASLHRDVLSVGAALRAAGLVAGDRVLLMLPNTIEAVWAWLGTNVAGGIDSPVSAEAAGASLRHVVDDVTPRFAIGTSELLKKVLHSSPDHGIEVAFVVGEGAGGNPLGSSVRHVPLADAMSQGGDLPPLPGAHETATVMFSSGSTGPPKGVMLSHGYYAHIPVAHRDTFGVRAGTVVYCAQPLCHIDARITLIISLLRQFRFVLAERFSARAFWRDVERHDADVFCFIGAMLPILFKQPDDGTLPAKRRTGIGSAIPTAVYDSFVERYNCDLVEGYGLTEFPALLNQQPGSGSSGNVGRELPGSMVMIVDSQGLPAADGEPGQLLARPTTPHAMMQGYWNRPEATVRAWQNLWFHTGDLMRRLPDGSYAYHGRVKDSIRRRGENVSAWEVERVALQHGRVLEAAAIGVPSPLGEEDVALVVVPTAAGLPDPAELRRAMAADLPRFAVPRYIDVVASLPKTPSERVAKAVLRERGLSDLVIDFETD